MTKKTKITLAVIAACLVWGNVLRKWYINYQAEQELEVSVQNYSKLDFSPLLLKKDTFDIVFPDVDPFLKKSKFHNKTQISQTVHSSNKKKNVNPRKTQKETQTIKKAWPQIKYLGFVKNRDQNTTLCLLKINNRSYHVQKGGAENGVLVSQVYRDSVHLVFQGEDRTFVKR